MHQSLQTYYAYPATHKHTPLIYPKICAKLENAKQFELNAQAYFLLLFTTYQPVSNISYITRQRNKNN